MLGKALQSSRSPLRIAWIRGFQAKRQLSVSRDGAELAFVKLARPIAQLSAQSRAASDRHCQSLQLADARKKTLVMLIYACALSHRRLSSVGRHVTPTHIPIQASRKRIVA
jgi:hypothetical protein